MQKKRRYRKRKCRHCKKLYMPDPRTRDRQKYCSDPECQLESKKQSQKRWWQKKENRGYFCGPAHVERTRQWRRKHPDYAQNNGRKTRKTLQDDSVLQPPAGASVTTRLTERVLQDDFMLQDPVIVGIISNLTGYALQEDIELFIRKLQARGQCILGKGPGIETTGACYGQKNINTTSAGTARAGPL